MVISEPKPFQEIIDSLQSSKKIFLIGCGDCATACKSGGEDQLQEMKKMLEAQGKAIVGMCIPESTCIAGKLKTELAKHMPVLRQADAILVLACGLAVASVKGNDRLGLEVLPANNTVFGAVMDGVGNFYEKCSLCGECVLAVTGGICPITLCPKGLLNGPCGGMNKGKCELDKDRDCGWVLIYRELEKKQALSNIRKVQAPRDHKKALKPHTRIVCGSGAQG